MARLYADEQFPLPVVALLRNFGHDALTIQEAGNTGDDDPEVLAFAVNNDRVPFSRTGKMPVPQRVNFLVEQASCLFIKG